MDRKPVELLFCLIAVSGLASGAADGFEDTVKPFVTQNCIGCHNSKLVSGALNLEALLGKPIAPPNERELWYKVAARLKAGEMPPKVAPKPAPDRVAAVVGSIEREFERLDRNTRPDPGRITARRLNRYEYNNTIRDLLAFHMHVAEDFPVDPYGYGFDNIGDVLSLSPLLTERYLKAAERIAKAAIPAGPPEKVISTRYTSQAIGQAFKLNVQVVHDFPADGEYVIHTAWEQGFQAGTRMTGYMFLDGKVIEEKPIQIYTEMDRGFYSEPIFVTQGPHKAGTEMVPAANAKGPKPFPEFLMIRGPLQPPAPESTASYKRIMVCGHATGQHQPACARRILTPLLRRAYRRTVQPRELDRMLGLVKMAQDRGDTFESGIRIALTAILMSPNFLFRVERDPASPRPVSNFELASRLSYFLWSSMPDDELLALAEKGKLRDRATLRAQVRRMLSDPRSRSLAENFGGQWLQTRNLQAIKPDAARFPEWDAELRDLMQTETEMFFQSILSDDRSVLDFLDGRFTFLNQRLAKFYGIEGVAGREFRRVELDGHQRAGVLTQASVLAVSSYPTRTSPVIRGKWVLENLLNAAPPPPPPDVPVIDEKASGVTVSMRQQLEQHRVNPACAACHNQMDPLGFGLENYDAIGRWRTEDGKFPIDPSGKLPNGKAFSGAEELRAILKADSGRFVRALTDKMLTYALGRGLEVYDRPAVEAIAKRVERNGFRFFELVHSIVDSVPFQQRRGIPAEGTSQK